MKSKIIVSIIALVLVLALLLGVVGFLSKGFKDWDYKNWVKGNDVGCLDADGVAFSTYSFNEEDYLYDNSDKDYIVITGVVPGHEQRFVQFPKRIKGKFFFGFTDNVFKNNKILEKFLFPRVAFSVPYGFFGGCTKLKQVYFPLEILSIGMLGEYSSENNIYLPAVNQLVIYLEGNRFNGEPDNLSKYKVIYGYAQN